MDSSNCFKGNTAHRTERLYSGSEKMLFMKEICRFLQKGVIKQVDNLERGYVSSIFQKRKGKQKYCFFKLREIYINTHAYQMVSYQLQEYLPKYGNLYFQLSGRKVFKLWGYLDDTFLMGDNLINAKMQYLQV